MQKTSMLKNSAGWKVVRHYIVRYKRDAITLGVLSVISAMANAAVPYLVGRLVDGVIDQDTVFAGSKFVMPTFFLFVGIWVIAKIIADIVDKQINFYSDKLDGESENEYRVAGWGKILTFPLSFHKQKRMGEVFEGINRAAHFLSRLVSNVAIDLLPQFLSIVIALGITLFIKPIMTVMLVGAVFLYVLILFKIAPRLSKIQLRMYRTYDAAYGEAYDSLLNVQTVKQAVAEKYEKRKMHRNFYVKALSLWMKMRSIFHSLSFYQRLLVTLTQFGIFILSIIFIRAGSMTIGELIMFNGYAAMFFGPFVILGRNWQTIQNGLAAIVRSEAILRTPAEIYKPKSAVIISSLQGNVEFRNVSFRYQKKGRIVLENINFQVQAGMNVALVGESGVGKTTLVDLISLYYRPTYGKILIDGHDIAKLDLAVLRSQIAVVPQDVILFNSTIKNNIRYGYFNASDEEVKEAAQLAHANEFIESFPKKYNQRVGERGARLSTGQKQRVSIARAILRNPRILILDEPTSALDAKSEQLISESFEELMRGRTTFIIAHRLSTVRRADLILVFAKGKIVESGTHEMLMEVPDGAYRRLYELQIGLK